LSLLEYQNDTQNEVIVCLGKSFLVKRLCLAIHSSIGPQLLICV